MIELSKRPLIMGILNVTPDSFSGDGILMHKDYIAIAIDIAAHMIGDGADILDVGGESSRPGAIAIDTEEEIRRTVPIISAIKDRFKNIALSIDTTKARVAEVALNAGATIINDISALKADPDMAALAHDHKAYVVLMHNRSNPLAVANDPHIGGAFLAPNYNDIVNDVAKELGEIANEALKAGIAKNKIILDPGLGFGKTVEQNLALINHLDKLKSLGYQVMIGPSRKSFIGRVLDLPVEERLAGTTAAVITGILRGADIVRVHDVGFIAHTVKMTRAIEGS